MMTDDRLRALIARFPAARIAIVGDFFLDKYLDVDPALAETSIETGKVAHQVTGARCDPGAAGTVTNNLAALGAGTLHAVGFTGDDGEGHDLRAALARIRCATDHLHRDPARRTPTYLKPRNADDPSLAGEHSRYDTKNRLPTPPDVTRRIVASVDRLLADIDALVVMDQVEEDDCGAVTTAVRDAVAAGARRHPRVVVWADSRRRIRRYRGVITKPNQFEAVGRDNPLPGEEVALADLERAVAAMRRETGAPVCATRGAAGMVVSDPAWTVVPGVRVEGPTDPTGAGDSATAGAVLALVAGATLPEAALVGCLVASITVQQLGKTGTASPEALPPRLALWRAQQEEALK
jgi:bifunctional ADP-heptose synthase (sugar kinase/adenylyltransferase)